MPEKTLDSPLGFKEIQLVNPKGNQSWIFIGRTDVEAEIPILWSPDAKSWLIGKNPDAGKDWGQEEKGQWRMRWLDGIIDLLVMSLSKLLEIVKDMESWCAVHGATKSLMWLNDWTAKTNKIGWSLECKWKKRGKKTQKWWNNWLWISQVSKYISKIHLSFWVNPADLAYRVVHYCTNYMSQFTWKIPSSSVFLLFHSNYQSTLTLKHVPLGLLHV